MAEATAPATTDFETDDLLAEFDDQLEGPSTEPDPPADPGPEEEEAALSATAEEVPQEGEETEELPADEAPAAELEAPQPEEDTAPEYQPFRPKADGREIEVEGALRGSDGSVYFPPGTWERQLQPYLADRTAWRQKEQQYQQRIQQAEERAQGATAEQQARLQAFEAEIDKMLRDPDYLVEFVQDFERKAPILRAEMEKAQAIAERDRYRQGLEPYQAREQEAEMEPIKQQGLANYITAIAQDEAYKGLQLDLEGVFQTLWENQDLAFTRAPADDPASGVRKGELAVNLKAVRTLIDREAAALRRTRTNTQAAIEAARRNAATLNRKNAPPPTVGARGDVTPQKPQSREIKDADDWIAALNEPIELE